jgi:N-acetylglucosaminyldiphosphoundecaprenol N-acetyl-beta-D-mannosaminyltransferase
MSSEIPQVRNFTIGGVGISCVDRARAIGCFFDLIAAKCGGYVTATGAHAIVEAQTDLRLREIVNAARMSLPDGMPVQWTGRLKQASVERVHGADFFEGVLRDPRAASVRHYFYGGKPEILARIVTRATELIGCDAICGWHSPPIRAIGAIEEASVAAEILASRPGVIWVGLGTPKQEYWMGNHTARFPASLLVGVGAAFDYFAGELNRAPYVMQLAGLEWLARLVEEPRRLWPRYSRIVPRMIGIMAREALDRRKAHRTT